MLISLIAGVSIAAAFAALGALTVKVSVLTLALQGLALITVAALILSGWTRFNGRLR